MIVAGYHNVPQSEAVVSHLATGLCLLSFTHGDDGNSTDSSFVLNYLVRFWIQTHTGWDVSATRLEGLGIGLSKARRKELKILVSIASTLPPLHKGRGKRIC